ncbi:MAG TPA: ABC transporter ATP-binding protein [Gaiellaceae bacterium]|nr:ABC transporter ATP-binding protein [Gaiellaceae bacterium]
MSDEPLLEVCDLVVSFDGLRAVDGVSFQIAPGPFGLGLVGESGSGKSTIARAVVRLLEADRGEIRFLGADVRRLRRAALRRYRQSAQIVFQDPDGTLDPRMRIGAALAEAVTAHRKLPRAAVSERVDRLLHEVGLDQRYRRRFPHQLSGGQRQRVAIARALAVEPRLLVLDEPTSALDVTVQAKVLELIAQLRSQHALAYLLISHNLAVVEQLCEGTVVLYRGKVMEAGPTEQLLNQPAHPYTQALRAAVPDLEPRPPRTVGAAVVATSAAQGTARCPYYARCPLAVERCRDEEPPLRDVAGRSVACHRAEDALALADHPLHLASGT